MKKRICFKSIALFLIIVIATFGLSACKSKKSEIEELMTEFETSCVELDIDGMLNCINPQISDKIKLAAGIAGMLSNQNTDEILESIAELLTGDTSINSKDFFSSIHITLNDIKIKSESGTADAIVEYNIAGEDFKKEASFEYIYTMEKWYISGFNFK